MLQQTSKHTLIKKPTTASEWQTARVCVSCCERCVFADKRRRSCGSYLSWQIHPRKALENQPWNLLCNTYMRTYIYCLVVVVLCNWRRRKHARCHRQSKRIFYASLRRFTNFFKQAQVFGKLARKPCRRVWLSYAR